jgi:hypothetical protein
MPAGDVFGISGVAVKPDANLGSKQVSRIYDEWKGHVVGDDIWPWDCKIHGRPGGQQRTIGGGYKHRHTDSILQQVIAC